MTPRTGIDADLGGVGDARLERRIFVGLEMPRQT
jgi:hypothetical protein